MYVNKCENNREDENAFTVTTRWCDSGFWCRFLHAQTAMFVFPGWFVADKLTLYGLQLTSWS